MKDVAILGYGPVGALLANLLGQAGLSVAVYERETAVYPLPRAVHFDGEVMRIFRSAGLAESIAAETRLSSQGMHFVNAKGRTLMARCGVDGRGPRAVGLAKQLVFPPAVARRDPARRRHALPERDGPPRARDRRRGRARRPLHRRLRRRTLADAASDRQPAA